MKITSKGQITIPLEIRIKTGLLPDTEVEFVLEGKTVRLKKKNENNRGKNLIAKMTGKGSVKLSTKEILALTRD